MKNPQTVSFADGVAEDKTSNQLYLKAGREEMLAYLPPNRDGLKVLEIGCGEGGFAAQLTATCEVWGIEPFEPAADVAAQRLHRVFAQTFDAAKPQLPLDYFDIVVCNDVIEHMTDHDAFMLVGSLPNVRHYKNLFSLLIAQDWHYQDSGVLDRTHFRFFTIKSIRRSLQEAGFVVERLEGLPGGFYKPRDLWLLATAIFAFGYIAITLGCNRDILSMQIAFRGRKPG
jgi:SAM-dependent methyltransferase